MQLTPEKIRESDLNEDTRMICEVIGMEATLRLIEIYGGTRLHIQSPVSLRQRIQRERAREMYDGTNALEVCQATGLNPRRLRELIKKQQGE